VERWCQAFEEACRERGVRVTVQRLAVYRALAEDPTHPTVEAIHSRVAGRLPALSLASAYRILEALEAEGFVRRVSTTDGAARFDGNLEPHQHLVCRACGRMTDLEDARLAALRPPAGLPEGFAAEGLDIRVVGTCQDCRRPQSAARAT